MVTISIINLINQRMEDSSIEKQDVTDLAIAVVQVSVSVILLRNITPTYLGRTETGKQSPV